MTSKYFGVPFANSGDQVAIPDASQPDGSVSFEQGWGLDYAKDQATDPNAKDIPRDKENYFKFVVTEALKELQEYGFKLYDAIVNYPVSATTIGSDGCLYTCKIANGPATVVVNPVGNPATWVPKDKTVPFTGGGSLIAGAINELQDGDTYILPPANSLPANSFVVVELPDKFSSFSPLVIVDNVGTETITNSVGTDTEIIFNAGSRSARFTTDGATSWRV